MIELFARREPTTDPIVLRYCGTGREFDDVVIYADADCTRPKARYAWGSCRPDRRYRYVMLNCYRWRLVWIEDLPCGATV